MKVRTFMGKRFLSLILALTMLFSISIVALAAGGKGNGDGTGGGNGNAGVQEGYAGDGSGFQMKLADPDTTMKKKGGTYALEMEYDSAEDIVFTFSFNPNGGQKGFGIYPATENEPAGFNGVIIYDKADETKTPVLSLGGNYSEETMNPDFFFDEVEDKGYPDHYIFKSAENASFRVSDLTIKADALESGKTYCLYFPSTIKTYNNGKSKNLGCDVTIEFTTKAVEQPVEPETPAATFTGLSNEADENGDWWYYTDNEKDTTYTGVAQNKYGWWRVESGKVNFKANSIYQNEYGWWKTTNGKVTFNETGVFQNQYGWWRVEGSKVNFNANSIYQNQYGWWKTTGGKVTFNENGLFKNQYGTWKVEKSKVNFGFNGTYQGKTIVNGKVK